MKRKTAKAIAAAITMALTPALAPAATVVVNLSVANVYKADGTTLLPTGSAIVILADTNQNGLFGDLTQNSYAPDAGDTAIIAALNGNFGDNGSHSAVLEIDLDLIPANTKLQLAWYDSTNLVTPGEGVAFGTFRSDAPTSFSDLGWFVPNAPFNGALNFLTEAFGGEFGEAAGAASQQTAGGVVPVAELSISTSQIDFGKVLVGSSATDADVAVENVGDAGSIVSGTFGGATGDFSPAGDEAFGPLGEGESDSRAYDFNPTARGVAGSTVQVSSDAGDGQVELTGQGVAPVGSATGDDAGLVRVGTTGTATVTVSNSGDGNESGLGAISNLQGSAEALAGVFVGAGGVVSVADGQSAEFDYDFTPTAIGAVTEDVAVELTNGSSDGTNSAESLTVSVDGTGVGPIASFTNHVNFDIDLGDVVLGDVVTHGLGVGNAAILGPDNDSLTDLSVLAGLFSGDEDFSLLTSLVDALARKGGAELLLELQFVADELGVQTATLVLNTDEGAALGGDGSDFSFFLRANVILGDGGPAIPSPSTLMGGLGMLLVGALRRNRR